ncbi:flavin-containing monooxygenase [Endozoicomonas numazuensis]|uniref:Monooxygenase n=1 Tax=Endozoicomonas numazuensis TaxID=1137799 RepID=A0A081NGV1_9GAMM|nr:NAD(P)-binding domain-containing protein [Endozoicomonas numazuensis]KEQ17674.1 hypothetical protein GZ78_08235 [Endozoicomonas numazuensis]
MSSRKKIAVIGAGPAGLITAQVLVESGVDVIIFERRECLGGSWALQSLTEIPDVRDGLSHVYSAAFPSLKTNFPKSVMEIWGFPYPVDTPVYPSREQVCNYLESFAKKSNLIERIRFQHRLTGLKQDKPSQNQRHWKVLTEPENHEVFSGVVFCNGRYSTPSIPGSLNLADFSGKLEHSVSYRKPEYYRNKRVAVMGTGPSGEDISREISAVASRVYLCAHQGSREHLVAEEGFYGAGNNITRHRDIVKCQKNTLILEDGEKLDNIEVLILCTGYRVEDSILTSLRDTFLSGNQLSVAPLYMNLFHPAFPELSVTGMEIFGIPFILYQYQARVIARQLKEELALPSVRQRWYAARKMETMQTGRLSLEARREISAIQLRRLARMAQISPPAAEIFLTATKSSQHRKKYPNTYRDIPWE